MRPPSRVTADGRLARVHLDRLGGRARFVGELIQRDAELRRIDAKSRPAHAIAGRAGRPAAAEPGRLLLAVEGNFQGS
jgi:hypothetical protein